MTREINLSGYTIEMDEFHPLSVGIKRRIICSTWYAYRLAAAHSIKTSPINLINMIFHPREMSDERRMIFK